MVNWAIYSARKAKVYVFRLNESDKNFRLKFLKTKLFSIELRHGIIQNESLYQSQSKQLHLKRGSSNEGFFYIKKSLNSTLVDISSAI